MKIITFLLMGLITTFSATAKETLACNVVADQNCILADSRQEVTVKIDLIAAQTKQNSRVPLNIAVVLDRSGSMSGSKLEQAKQAAIELVNQLDSKDIFSLVAYDNEVEILIPAQPVEDKEHLKKRISQIEAGGATALYAGVEQGADQIRRYFSAKKINRVILLSDGLANIGPSSNEEISTLGRRLAREEIAVTTMGIGDDYNEDLLASLAEASDANYYYVKDVEKLPEIFKKELGELFSVVARNIVIEITLPEGVEAIDFIGRPETFKENRAKISFSHLASGQNRYLFLRCRAPQGKDEETLTLAKIKTIFNDETDQSKTQTLEKTVQIQFTKDRKKALASVNQTISAERELMGSSVARDEAVQQADANNYKEAARILNQRAQKLNQAYASAPPVMQPKIKEEQQALTRQAEDMEKGDMSKSDRKVMKASAYQQKNAKYN